jgi:bacteriocin-like protein
MSHKQEQIMNQPILVSTTIVPAAPVEAAQGSNSTLTDEEMDNVSGGATFHYPIRSNGDDPFVQVVVLAEKEAYYKASFYHCQGWKD